ncbi:MAG: hypothetical protein KatS3mg111_3730 [Pirellulaceae bacterium]|nr:MAG: hypothetical protein KatS3mg111_3730 [Pirellulaceae bacterium]
MMHLLPLRRSIALLPLLLVVTSCGMPTAWGREFFVRVNGRDTNTGLSPGQALRTIQRALDLAAGGDTIYVGGGTYTEKLSKNFAIADPREFRLIGDVDGKKTGDRGPVIVRSPLAGTWTATFLFAHRMTIEHIDFHGAANAGPGNYLHYGVLISAPLSDRQIQLVNCTVENFLYGVKVHGVVVQVGQAGYVRFDQCRFANSYLGVVASQLNELQVEACVFADAFYGCHLTTVAAARVVGCQFDVHVDGGNPRVRGMGIYASGSGITVDSCRFRNLTTAVYGLLCTELSVRQCEIDQARSTSIYATGGHLAVQATTVRAFVAPDRSWGSGYGMYLVDTEGGRPELVQVVVDGAYAGIIVRNRPPLIQDCSARNCYMGMYLYTDADQVDLSPANVRCQLIDNYYGIYSICRNRVRLGGLNITGNTYGVYHRFGRIELTNCTFAQNYYGAWLSPADNDNDAVITDCSFTNNYKDGRGAWGLAVDARQVTITGTRATNNHHGIYVHCRQGSPVLQSLEIADNAVCGLYHEGPLLELSDQNQVRVSRCQYGVVAYGEQTRLNNFTGPTQCQYGLYGRLGELSMNRASFNQCDWGVYYYRGRKFTAANIRGEGNKYAVLYPHTAAQVHISDGVFRHNGYGGIYVVQGQQLEIENCYFAGSTSRDAYLHSAGDGRALVRDCVCEESKNGFQASGWHQLDLRGCRFSLAEDAESCLATSRNQSITIDDCQFANARYGIYGNQDQTIHITNCRGEDLRSWGVYLTSTSAGQIADCRFDRCYGGIAVSPLGGTCAVTNCSITQATRYGIYGYRPTEMAGSMTVANVDISGVDGHGVYFRQLPINRQTVHDVTIRGATQYALFGYQAAIDIDANCRLNLTNNRYAIVGEQADMRLTKVTIAENDIGVYNNRGTLEIADCQIQGNVNGIVSTGPRLQVSETQVQSTNYGIYHNASSVADGGHATLTDVQVAGARYGIYANGWSSALGTPQGSVTVQNARCHGNTYGLLLYHQTQANLSNLTLESGVYGVYLHNSPCTMTSAQIREMSSWGIVTTNGVPIDVRETVLASTQGVYVHSSPAARFADVQIDAPVYGLRVHDSIVSVDRTSITNARSHGFYLSGDDSEVTINRSQVLAAASWAVAMYDEGQFQALSSRFNSSNGIYAHNGRSLWINCIIDGSQYGMYVLRSGSTHDLLHCTVANVSRYGLVLYRGNVTLRNSILDSRTVGIYKADDTGRLQHDHNLITAARPYVKGSTRAGGGGGAGPRVR